MSMNYTKSTHSSELELNYIRRSVTAPKRLFLLLHGIAQNSEFIFKKLKNILPADCDILACDAPFPVNLSIQDFLNSKRERKLLKEFSWYFFDPANESFPISMNFSAKLLSNCIKDLYEDLPVTIIGYSQGGYLAPFVAEMTSNVDHIIGINSSWRWDLLKNDFSIRIDSLNGDSDLNVDPKLAKEKFDKLKEKNSSGKFYFIKNEGHRLTDAFLLKIKELL